MRETLFRGKLIKGEFFSDKEMYVSDEWVEGSLCDLDLVPIKLKGESDRVKCPHMIIYDNEKQEFKFSSEFVHPETVGQYIGSTDKNHKKIFEGDIVKLPLFTNGVQAVGIVFWHNRYAKFCIKTKHSNVDFYSYLAKEVIVIGNIHDNPELLKGGAENDR